MSRNHRAQAYRLPPWFPINISINKEVAHGTGLSAFWMRLRIDEKENGFVLVMTRDEALMITATKAKSHGDMPAHYQNMAAAKYICGGKQCENNPIIEEIKNKCRMVKKVRYK